MLRSSRSPYLLSAVTLAVFAVVAVPVVVELVLRSGHRFGLGGEALAWEGPLVVLHVSADLLIGVAYVNIAFTLVPLARLSGGATPFIWAFVAFGLFFVACGLTHMAAVLTV
jgi:hypothetical protein